MPLVQTRGAASAQGFGEFAQATAANYIEDVFSTYLYTGNSSTQTIDNGIDLSTKGGMVWLKGRSLAVSHYLYDTVRGIANGPLSSENTNAAYTANTPKTLTSFNTNGFSMQDDSASFGANVSPRTQVSWTFRKQPKFFDVVTYTGTGSARTVAHNLGSVPGCVIVKRTDSSGFDWAVYHRSTGNTQRLLLNTTDPAGTSSGFWNDTTPTSTVFTVGTNVNVNASGGTYVAYIFAHDAGGFGLTGTDNVISCGSYVGTGAVGNAVTLGYEPQWLLVKNITSAFDWILYDNMRGMPASATNTGDTKFLRPNLSNAEAGGGTIIPTATGFQANTTYQGSNFSGETYIYIAIRRGPMKVPTDATKVFNPYNTTSVSNVGSTTANTYSTGIVTDTIIQRAKSSTDGWYMGSRLQGAVYLKTETTAAEIVTPSFVFDSNVAAVAYAASYGLYSFRRAPSFMDVVCFTGTGSSPGTQNHNLGVIPEFILTKKRNASQDWYPFFQNGSVTNWTQFFALSSAAGSAAGDLSADVSATTFSANTFSSNNSGSTYVAYLFATCPGVSKVGSYTGNGTTQTINCGFGAGGARFVLIKRTDSTGDWYVYDTARGMTVLTDPYLWLNSTAAEVATLGSVTTVSTGFAVNASVLAAINTNAANYVFLAIA